MGKFVFSSVLAYFIFYFSLGTKIERRRKVLGEIKNFSFV